MALHRGFFYLKDQQNGDPLKFFFKTTFFLLLSTKTKRDLEKKNPTWSHSGRSSEQNETNMTIGLIDFCQTYQPGSKMSF